MVGAVGLALDVDDRIRLLEIERTASKRASFLERTNRVLVESLDMGVVVEQITSAAIQELADWCSLVVTIDQPDGAPLVAVAHTDPDMVVWAKRLQKQFPYDATATSGVPNVVRTGIAEFVPMIDDAVLDAAVTIQSYVRSSRAWIFVPRSSFPSWVVSAPSAHYNSCEPRTVRHSPMPTSTRRDLAGAIGAALNNTILFRRQQAAQQALGDLQRVTARLETSRPWPTSPVLSFSPAPHWYTPTRASYISLNHRARSTSQPKSDTTRQN